MFEANVQRVLDRIGPNDVVLDIGGWACPFNRANYVLDAEPYETRGYYATMGGPASLGPSKESFSRETWIRRDICDHERYPFADKSIDFVVCSHVLEDVRDPLWVCSEMNRIAKRGYIEMPSRIAESSRGWEHPRIVGLSHHRWSVDIQGNFIEFFHKHHALHSHWRYSLPASYLKGLPPEQTVQALFWDGSFTFREVTIHGEHAVRAALSAYVERTRPYPTWRVKAADYYDLAHGEIRRVVSGIRRRLPGARS